MTLHVATVLHATNADVFEVLPSGEVVSTSLTSADLNRPIGNVYIDSREDKPGGLFVALAGERADGHEYIREALRSGGAALAQRLPASDAFSHSGAAPAEALPRADKRLLFLVPDSLRGLQQLAHYWRMHHTAEVVGVTGSIGKTTVKEIASSVLGHFYPVQKNEANLNTEIGLPLTLLGIRPDHRMAIVEMAMHATGEIGLLARIAQPRIGVVTNVAPIHLERMGTIDRIARAKSELIASLPPDGLAVLNGDDPWTRAMARTSGSARVRLVGFEPGSDYRAVDVESLGLQGTRFKIEAEGQVWPVTTQVPGTHTVYAFLIAAAIGRECDLPWGPLIDAMNQTRFEARQRVLQGPDHMLIIDDSYNAAPPSMSAALDLLRQSSGERIAVLGDMLELGPQEEEAHRSIGEHAAASTDWLVVRGGRATWIAEGAAEKGLAANRILRASSNDSAVELVTRIAFGSGGSGSPTTIREAAPSYRDATSAAKWTVLVKGSRGMRMEEVVEGLRGATS